MPAAVSHAVANYLVRAVAQILLKESRTKSSANSRRLILRFPSPHGIALIACHLTEHKPSRQRIA